MKLNARFRPSFKKKVQLLIQADLPHHDILVIAHRNKGVVICPEKLVNRQDMSARSHQIDGFYRGEIIKPPDSDGLVHTGRSKPAYSRMATNVIDRIHVRRNTSHFNIGRTSCRESMGQVV